MSNRREFQCQLCKRRYKFQRTLDRHKCKEAQPGASADDVLMNYNVDRKTVNRIAIQPNADQRTVDSHNPVMDMSLMNLTEKDFEGCRITANNEFSVIDAIAKFRGVDSKHAQKIFTRFFSDDQTVDTSNFIKKWKFPGQGQRPTPVCKFKDLLLILSQLPGPEAKALRAQQSEIATRAVAGDVDLERALPQRRAELSSEMQDVVMEGLPSSEPTDKLRRRDLEKQYEIKDARRNLEMELFTAEHTRRMELFTAEHTRRMEKMRLQAAKEDMDMLESMGLLDDHMRSFVGSSARNIVLSSSYTTSPRLALGKPPTEQTSTDAIWVTLERVATVNGLKMSGKDAMRLGRVAAKAVRERFPDETERRDVMCKFQDGEVYASNGKRVLPWHYRGDAKALVAGILRKELPSL